MHPPERDWALVAPWWKWPDPKESAGGRVTGPVIQKYETSDLVNAFIANPQRCLTYGDEDLVQTVEQVYDVASGVGGKARLFGAAWDAAKGAWFRRRRVPLEPRTRKIFLPTHKRFYLVVAQLHCDAPGFPRTSRQRVCLAGFVGRRRTTPVPSAGAKEGKAILGDIARDRSRVSVIDAVVPGLKLAAERAGERGGPILERASLEALAKQRGFVLKLLEADRKRLADWAMRLHVQPALQGWFPTTPKLDGVGTWKTVAETPETLGDEATFPMYPLIPPDGQPEHAGRFGTVFFGLLPAYLADHDPQGRPRFDDQEYFEVRCFAKRHLEPHDRGAPCRCPDKLFWSPPTEPYRIASHYDLTGTAHHPVTIQLPDLAELAAQTPPVAGATFQKPAGSIVPKANDGKAGNGGLSGFQICTIPIPLITIIASFVLELFLPIVVFLFGLWWMLLLKICIPPSISVAAGVTAELDASMSASAEANLKIGGVLLASLTDASADANFADLQARADVKATYSPIAIANWELSVKNASAVDVTAGVTFEAEVPHP